MTWFYLWWNQQSSEWLKSTDMILSVAELCHNKPKMCHKKANKAIMRHNHVLETQAMRQPNGTRPMWRNGLAHLQQ